MTSFLLLETRGTRSFITERNFHMTDMNVPQNELEIKHVGQAIECGTLEVLLNATVYQPVFLTPLQRTLSYGLQTILQWAVHLTVQPHTNGPVYYATFLAAQVREIGGTIGLTSPYRFMEPTAPMRANMLQQELTQCLCEVVTQHPRVNSVIQPARYRLPDEWVWSNRCNAGQIHMHEQHWTVSKSNTSF
jgi:hypothetical protein